MQLRAPGRETGVLLGAQDGIAEPSPGEAAPVKSHCRRPCGWALACRLDILSHFHSHPCPRPPTEGAAASVPRLPWLS